MPALLTPGGGSPSQTWVPNWQPGAVSWTRQSDLRQFTAPSNPVRMDNSAPTFVTNRQTQDGLMTHIWAPNAEQPPLTFTTFEEGLAPWKAFREQFRGVPCTYYNALDRAMLPVVVVDVAWHGDGRNPVSYTVTVTQQEAEASF